MEGRKLDDFGFSMVKSSEWVFRFWATPWPIRSFRVEPEPRSADSSSHAASSWKESAQCPKKWALHRGNLRRWKTYKKACSTHNSASLNNKAGHFIKKTWDARITTQKYGVYQQNWQFIWPPMEMKVPNYWYARTPETNFPPKTK